MTAPAAIETGTHPVERAEFRGLLGALGARVRCRPDSPAYSNSPVPWDVGHVWPFAVELWVDVPCRDGGGPILVVFTWPCTVDPRVPSIEADSAIAACVQRAMSHEGCEALILDGLRRTDPHVIGEPYSRLHWQEATRVAEQLDREGYP